MISFILVNYNLSSHLRKCIDSLQQHIPTDYEIIVVDNASHEKSWLPLKSDLQSRSAVRVIQRESNAGFGAACNEGARMARGDILCFLNPDIVIHDNFIRHIEEDFRTHADAWIVGIRTRFSKWMDFSAGPAPNLLLELLGVLLIGRYIEAIWMRFRTQKSDRPVEVGWVMGACLFIPIQRYDELHGFDQDYFLYYEEMDLCHRARRSGGRVYYDPRLCVEHEGSPSGVRDYAAFTERFFVAKQMYFGKQFDGISRFTFLTVVKMQMLVQLVLWSMLWMVGNRRSGAKLKGLRAALVSGIRL